SYRNWTCSATAARCWSGASRRDEATNQRGIPAISVNRVSLTGRPLVAGAGRCPRPLERRRGQVVPHVPQPHGTIRAAGGERLAVARESHAEDPRRMAFQNDRLCLGSEIVETHLAIATPQGQQLAVR